MDDPNPRAVIGGNNPPEPTRDEKHAQLVNDVVTLAEKGNELPATVETDEHLNSTVELVKAAKKLASRLDDTRKAENEPANEEIKGNNAFFGSLVERMKRMASVLEDRVGTYTAQKREEERRRLAAEAEARQRAADEERARLAAEAPASGIESEMAEERQQRIDDAAKQAEARAFKDTGPTRTTAGTVGTRKGFEFRVRDYSALDLTELKESFGVDAIEKAIRDHIRRHKNTRPLKGVEIFGSTKTNIR